MDISTSLIHADEGGERGLAPTIAQVAAWPHPNPDDFLAAATEPFHPRFYNRYGNPNHEQVATLVAELEGAERALVMASGMAAFAATVLALVKAGDHVVAQRSHFAGVSSLLEEMLPRLDVECTRVDQADASAWEAAIRPGTSLVLLETPSNPLLEVTDLRAVTQIAHRHGALTIADNTFATPVNQRPLEHGVDLAWHSATKYMGGHADLTAGVVAGRAELVERIWHTAVMLGAASSPFDAWLLLRGLRTLAVRMERHNRNAAALAQALAGHPAVRHVHYPGLGGHPGHAVARRQMTGFGGVLAFELAGGKAAAEAFIERLRFAQRAGSLGNVGSLVVHPAAMWANELSPEQLEARGLSPGLVRFATGIEHPDDLVGDVLGAADAAT